MNATNNPNLTCIFVDDHTYAKANFTDVDGAASFLETKAECGLYTAIPDANFEQALIDLGHDSGSVDGGVPTANINTLTSLNVSVSNISDLTGIEAFVALTNLDCSINSLTTLDLSTNTAITELDLSENQITTLDLSNNTAITELYLHENSLTTLDLSANTALEKLFVSDNQISALNLSNNTAITELGLSNNLFMTLDLSANTAITNLYVDTNQLTALDLSTNTAIAILDANDNQITTLDLSTNTAITELNLNNNKLTELDISANTAITKLSVNNNFLSTLDLWTSTYLTELDVSNNKLTSLDLRNGVNQNFTTMVATNNPDLSCIFVDSKTYAESNFTNVDATASFMETLQECTQLYTQIPDSNFEDVLKDLGYDSGTRDGLVLTANISGVTSLNVYRENINSLEGIEAFTSLTELNCIENHLTALDLSSNTALTSLYCADNNLDALDVSSNTALEVLSCGGNNLDALNVSNNTALTTLSCNNNSINALDVSSNTALTTLSCDNNSLTALDLSSNTALTELYCSDNSLSTLDLRNGANSSLTAMNATNNSSLTCIFVDSKTYAEANFTNIDATANFVETEAECNTLSIDDDVLLESDIEIYPIPAKDVIYVKTSLPTTKLEIYSASGKRVYESTNFTTINVSKLNSGVYFIRLYMENGSFVNKRIVIE
ncbi:hypothetical protein AXE80_07470 [Wenyingzhuangia fucanilytica]|uniref:Secretion system C-terminal sorting domain-containing protein n=1 Tax=Wenyingzhuangia fucanilytica TaxID=1790137 RepID=A0A1B1Y5T2_9FLAO|nr:T9SS type A sorting domain-containing protein [Wenyingzhuangia fucanilytica]ANW96125.1 hypothetical protein AXE80_07470 [Wenyingzhuangia fucanilytica]